MIELWIGLAMFGALLAALLIGIPVAFSLMAVGIGAITILGGGVDALGLVAPTLWSSVTSFTLTAVPLFILMGAIISASGMGARLYGALATLMHGVPGGLSVATTLACTIMAAVSGSSVATAGAIGRFSVLEMRRFGYRDEVACGAVAAGGTLGILIPPSIPLIVYGIIAQESIGALFIAGIIPGIIMALSFIGYQVWIARSEQARAPARDSERVSTRERLMALKHIVPVAILIWVILGTIYQGIATPTEAAALGVLASLVLSGAIYRELTREKLVLILRETAKGSVMVLMIIAGAMLFGYAMTTSSVAPTISRVVAELDVPAWAAFITINLLLIFLGCFMETLSIIVITAPILIPIIVAMGWDPIWFGIIMVINMEMALITPPVGLNLFVVQGVVEDVPLTRIIAGTLPYVIIMAAVLLLVGVFPDLATYLPQHIR
ncbi:TRAP transporter large permease subunit [Allopusillimonas soli]|uniref:TRAP transporter large permease protein n=1 Tax=Allopusillimonas soli TaxID=659016 RepID=A0A853FA74_9BURK|nr:TRAP transporter large permease subunit [Allopusillimonas soli]NYT36877.1 TRAP transporter large permease subunit [Allopusillimonas soli]TEA75336.1 TRAP transporter large permease subunit [Allopusillimonas soli]